MSGQNPQAQSTGRGPPRLPAPIPGLDSHSQLESPRTTIFEENSLAPTPLALNHQTSAQFQLELQKQLEINRRLNDLLNTKDEQIAQLSQKVMQYEEELLKSPGSKRKGHSPKSPPATHIVKATSSAVVDLENRLLDAKRENKEL